jgi:hypothetical protein
MDIKMLVRKFAGTKPQYLSIDEDWTSAPQLARYYVSMWAFLDAKENDAEVVLLFANGKELAVSYHEIFNQEGTLQ